MIAGAFFENKERESKKPSVKWLGDIMLGS